MTTTAIRDCCGVAVHATAESDPHHWHWAADASGAGLFAVMEAATGQSAATWATRSAICTALLPISFVGNQ
jgi:hypothetical protein